MTHPYLAFEATINVDTLKNSPLQVVNEQKYCVCDVINTALFSSACAKQMYSCAYKMGFCIKDAIKFVSVLLSHYFCRYLLFVIKM